MAVSIERKRKRDEDNTTTVSKNRRTSRSGEGSKQRFPKMCMICKSNNLIQIKGKRQSIHKITLQNTEEMLKAAAVKWKDETMIILIAQENLREREFMIHDKCYSEYVRVCREENDCETASNPKVENERNLEEVMKFIYDEILGGNRACSMELLTEIYGLDPKDRKHRLRLKEKLVNKFKDRLIFASVTYHSPQIVICADNFKSATLSSFLNDSKDYIVRKSAMYSEYDRRSSRVTLAT